MNKNTWTPSELALLQTVQPSLTTWKAAAAAFPGHSPEDCRQKWLSEFSVPAKNKGAWSADEDDRLRGAMQITTKWLKVAKIVKTRCSRQCQSRWVRMGKEDGTPTRAVHEQATTELPMDLLTFDDCDFTSMVQLTPPTEAEDVEQHWIDWMPVPESDCFNSVASDVALMDQVMVRAPVATAQIWPLEPACVELQVPVSSADIASNVDFWPDMSVVVQV
ncbi:hypothetical protein SDRG_06111 [Saprolegnia diclina VS20]|uniref:Myb-like domain-containing protein n=1 Tax=Saprolegnia diclina (strain VS20) TaxID=1156394 RepID=T0QRS5_SAPDV|nr:hypothetical protein SDRG_06111 [Saprolegnia diclina VS20]EQC36675.1 hypothetical protein SDRG_06111 [Saprolegnia diclina VS20]|eukprot:XP_008610096.1 hypothetical protein SDRG_06111 [Saprolegnia diclina VS20]